MSMILSACMRRSISLLSASGAAVVAGNRLYTSWHSNECEARAASPQSDDAKRSHESGVSDCIRIGENAAFLNGVWYARVAPTRLSYYRRHSLARFDKFCPACNHIVFCIRQKNDRLSRYNLCKRSL